MTEKVIISICGNLKEFKNSLFSRFGDKVKFNISKRSAIVGDRKYIYCNSIKHIIGLRALKVEFFGTFYNLPNFPALYNEAQLRIYN